MTIAAGVILSLMGVVWGLRRLRRARSSALFRQAAPLGQLDTLLRELENRGSSPRQELAAVRGGTPREHVWRAPGGEEVFLN